MVEHACGEAQGRVSARTHRIAVPVGPTDAESEPRRASVACLRKAARLRCCESMHEACASYAPSMILGDLQ